MELPPDALAVLAELGRSLGRYDAQTQREAIERAGAGLERILASLRERDASLDRLRVGLSAAAGALAALILY